VKFLAEDSGLTITFEGAEMIWAVKRKLVLPRSQIVDLRWEAGYVLPWRMLRIIGTDLPWVLWAGRFAGGGHRAFLYVQRPVGVTWGRNPQPMPNVLVLNLRDNRYDQVIVTCQPAIGSQLTDWWRGTERLESSN
jgi:hypothetical protein